MARSRETDDNAMESGSKPGTQWLLGTFAIEPTSSQILVNGSVFDSDIDGREYSYMETRKDGECNMKKRKKKRKRNKKEGKNAQNLLPDTLKSPESHRVDQEEEKDYNEQIVYSINSDSDTKEFARSSEANEYPELGSRAVFTRDFTCAGPIGRRKTKRKKDQNYSDHNDVSETMPLLDHDDKKRGLGNDACSKDMNSATVFPCPPEGVTKNIKVVEDKISNFNPAVDSDSVAINRPRLEDVLAQFVYHGSSKTNRQITHSLKTQVLSPLVTTLQLEKSGS